MQISIPTISHNIRARLKNQLPANFSTQIHESFVNKLCESYVSYLDTSRTEVDSYLLLRKLNFFTCGIFGDVFNDEILSHFCPSSFKRSDQSSIDHIAMTNLVDHGFSVISSIFTDSVYSKLLSDLGSLTYTCVDNNQSSHLSFCGTPDYRHENIGMKYTAQLDDLLQLPSILELLSNQHLISIAEEYLGGKVFIRSVDAWWKTPFVPKDYHNTADHYHRDCDHNRWLNLFLFLTPVSSIDGAHIFCPGTHQRTYSDFSQELYGDGRYHDDLIKRNAIESIAFESDTPLAVLEDTWGFHRASRCTTRSRLVVQIRYLRSIFGADVPFVPKSSVLPICNRIFMMPQLTSSQLIDSLIPLLQDKTSPERVCSLL